MGLHHLQCSFLVKKNNNTQFCGKAYEDSTWMIFQHFYQEFHTQKALMEEAGVDSAFLLVPAPHGIV